MSKDYTKELNTMYHLMNFGRDVKKQSTLNEGIVEYSQLGANGKTYGIIKEGTKYYIKVAPKKHTKILAEDYDYVGGYLNRKAYDSYTKASNALNLHLISVNESNGKNNPVKSQFNLNESAEWVNTQTKEAREDLNRFYQLVSRVDNLLNENVHYINENDKTYSEKPTKSPKGSTGKGGQQQPTGIKEKDWVKDNSKVDADKVYDKNGVKGKSPSGEYDAASGINDIDMTQGNPYQEKSKTSKEQGKNVFEGKRTIKLYESQGAEVVYEDSDWKIVIPHTKEASCIYGAHTKWCTAGRDSNMFDYYNKKGPLYININKQTGDKYQFHFESGSFIDAADREISPKEIGLSDGALEYYKSIGKELYFIYDEVGGFFNGFAEVKYKGKWYKLNTNGELYDENGNRVNLGLQESKRGVSGINDIDMTQGNPYQEKSKTSKEQGKNVFEGKRTIKISESQEKQIQAWRNKRAFVHTDADLDNSHSTEIGDTAPYVENVNESFETSEWDEGLPSTSGIGDAKQYTEPFEETLNEELEFNDLEDDGLEFNDLENEDLEFNDLEIPESDNWDDLRNDNNLKNAQLSNDRIEYQLNKYGNDPLVDEYDQDLENIDDNDMLNDTSIINENKLNQIISKNVKQLFEGRFKESDKFGYGHKTDANNLLNSDYSDLSDDVCAKIYDYLNKHGESTESLGLDVNNDDFTEIEPDEVNPDDSEESLEGYDDTDANNLSDYTQTGFKNHWDSETAAEQDNLNEVRLNDFGKHPAYHKKVMSLPQIGDESQWGRDWNDESTKSDKPFGIKIGHSGDPFTDLVNTITDAVVTEISKKKV